VILLLLLTVVASILAIPIFFVLKWKARPGRAFMIAIGTLFLTIMAISVLRILTAEAYGIKLDYLNFRGAVFASFFVVVICSPILALVQWMGRRKYRRGIALSAEQMTTTFD